LEKKLKDSSVVDKVYFRFTPWKEKNSTILLSLEGCIFVSLLERKNSTILLSLEGCIRSFFGKKTLCAV
jgi:hypothetical protein